MPDRASRSPFLVALTADFFDAEGKPKYRDMGLSVLDQAPGIQYFPFDRHEPRIAAAQLKGANGVIVLTPAVTAETLAGADHLLAIGRFGVGYDAVDVPACTAADVLVFITAGAVDRPVAEATVAWMLSLTHNLRAKHELVTTGRWDERSNYMGCELRDRVFGAIGFGGIARATVGLLSGFGMKQPLAFDPYLDAATARKYGVRSVSLPELLTEADFVSIHCPLTPATRGLIGKKEFAQMKSSAYLINTARGGIVDEVALEEALAERRIAGAALDCYAVEPVREPIPIARFENVVLAPHCIAWTDELFRDIGRMASQGMVDLAEGRRPGGVINPEVFERPGFIAKWERIRSGTEQQAART